MEYDGWTSGPFVNCDIFNPKDELLSHSSHKPTHPTPTRAESQEDGVVWPSQPLPAAMVKDSGVEWSEPKASSTVERPDSKSADWALAQRIKAGEREAVQELFQLYAPTLLRRILRLLGGDMSQAEDCLQQVFIKVMQSIDSYRGDSVLLAWLYRITTHTVVDVFRQRQSRNSLLEKVTNFRWSGWGEDGNQAIPETLFFREELKELVFQGLNTLGQNKRIAVLLCDLEGCSIEDAAEELNIPIGTLASRLYRGRQELKAWLKKEWKRSGLAAEDYWHD